MRSFCLPLSLPLLVVLACSGPNGQELFATNSVTTAPADGGFAAAGSGTGSSASQVQGGTSSALAGAGTSGVPLSGAGGAGVPLGGSGVAGVPLGGSGGGGVAIPPIIESCDMLEGAAINDENGNCYRANTDELTFDEARAACIAGGGHLVTIGTETEDDFVHALLDDAHWLGATDGRANGIEGVAPYTWVNGDEWDYSNWQDGQPNAVATNCPNENGGANCFEHCAYQDDSGGWNDRACWHTIASICEWEPVSK
jgi:hypothetical protein